MTEEKFAVGDPVWSKMKGYCPWPSRIAAPHESSLKNTATEKSKSKTHYLVYFFGSNNFAWMPEDTIKPYEQFKDKNKNGSKTSQFKQGLKQIEDYIQNGGRDLIPSAETASSTAIKSDSNNDEAASPSAGDSLSNDASNLDGDLPSIDEEIAAIHNTKLTNTSASPVKQKNSNDSHNDSSSLTSPAPASVQKDYSRTPFKSRKSARSDDTATETTSSPTKKVRTSDDDSYGTSSPTISSAISNSKPPNSKSGARNVLLRASQYTDIPAIDTPQINLNSISAKSRAIRPSSLKFGFIGLGYMGQSLLKNLLNSGHQVTIWNRTTHKCKVFAEAGAYTAATPSDVVIAADVVFACLSDPTASKEVVFGSFGLLSEISPSKALVEMSSIDPETSNDISEAIIAKGGRYLEAPMIGNGKKAAEDGEVTIIAAGDKSLYEDCSSCFQAMGKHAVFLGHQVGLASRMNLIFSMLYGNIIGALAECCSLVDRADIQMKEFKDILKSSIMNCPLIDMSLDKIMKKDTSVLMTLGHLQKDLRLALNMTEEYDATCPITAVTNETFKSSKRSGWSDHDASAVYLRTRY